MKKKTKLYLRLNLMSLFFVAVSFISVTLAWFVYSGLSRVTTEVTVKVNGVATTINIPADGKTFYCFAVKTGGSYDVVITPAGQEEASTNGVVNVTNASNVAYELQSFTYGDTGPENYQVITNNEIVPGNSIFGAIVVDSATLVTVTVNGAATTINIPANGKTFYCFAVKTGGNYDVVITPAA